MFSFYDLSFDTVFGIVLPKELVTLFFLFLITNFKLGSFTDKKLLAMEFFLQTTNGIFSSLKTLPSLTSCSLPIVPAVESDKNH